MSEPVSAGHDHEYRRQIVATSNPAFGVLVSECWCGERLKVEKPTVARPEDRDTPKKVLRRS